MTVRGCKHQDTTAPDWSQERYVICTRCGKAIHTHWTGRIFQQIMERISEGEPRTE